MIVSMWGLCDGAPIIFEKTAEETWQVKVPADHSDGTYVVEIWAQNGTGHVVYRTAILYMCDSRFVCLKWIDDGVKVSIRAVDHRIRALPDEIKTKVVMAVCAR